MCCYTLHLHSRWNKLLHTRDLSLVFFVTTSFTRQLDQKNITVSNFSEIRASSHKKFNITGVVTTPTSRMAAPSSSAVTGVASCLEFGPTQHSSSLLAIGGFNRLTIKRCVLKVTYVTQSKLTLKFSMDCIQVSSLSQICCCSKGKRIGKSTQFSRSSSFWWNNTWCTI